MPPDDIPDYLPDGTLNIHGKLAHKFTVSVQRGKNGQPSIETLISAPSNAAMLKEMNEEMDRAYRGE